ncbi:hypothetical protein ZWY2020_030517 [Hordeum vulgare]|nr:hypothetical protein ZWY2020_030517 [Hordeum vulgare]
MGVECRYEVAQAAYIKLALHMLKHPAAAVNRLLVGWLADPAASPAIVVSVIDAVPVSKEVADASQEGGGGIGFERGGVVGLRGQRCRASWLLRPRA